MLTKVDVYSALNNAPVIEIDESDSIDGDPIHVVNIDGLDPVAASINGLDSGSRDGVNISGESVGSRNLVLTLLPNPDYDEWQFATLRQALYSYFMPKSYVRLVFQSDEVGEVFIDGLVESCTANPFTNHPEYIVSIICPDPYFTSTEVKTLDHDVSAFDAWADSDTQQIIEIPGKIPIGFKLKVLPTGFDSDIIVQLGRSEDLNAAPSQILRLHTDTTDKIIELCSIPGKRYIRGIDPDIGSITNLLDSITSGSTWPMLQPGINALGVMAADNISLTGYTWEITYMERFGAI